MFRSFFILFSSFLINGCSVKVPSDIDPIKNFDLSRYLGEWYEVARIDNRFEKGLTQVSANYSLREDGGVKVVNKGWSATKKDWKESIGKAYFVESPQTGALKVSFFGPFYGGYNIIKLDDDYQYSLVVGPDKNYLWVLSRTPTMPAELLNQYIQFASELGFERQRILVFQ
ncbi:lipocalin family protein [Moellerella wisconsensis]|uniref:Outer membrane lipoprotein Blc n=2 Tax=Moellerella wisconsensis TaxID=158849 RepID=A0A9Q8PZX7_9GAMM|nr:lipocalin family protein [Moellerella wisconsensis]KLN96838.1 membrane protein [Moellerella wisconsensis]UNH23236.1 lipocalin family protein [Moellerella wisconsensis]UNH26312.1 lipocalin family protein [Moellerella wisconsensis]UNH29727.1 lipocalin family protein [Moellerella wisconsensis]UNH37923.1 lipocalin family protein [Moellerella wisconsensis]